MSEQPIRMTHPAAVLSALAVCVLTPALHAGAQDISPTRVTLIASATTGSIAGLVLDDSGQPLEGVVVSALGTSSSFAVSDRLGQFTLRQLMPGPYLLRAHREGYVSARNAMVNVRPSARTVSSFTLRREGPAEPHVLAAGMGGTTVAAAPPEEAERDESETAWRLRHLRRSILKDSATSFATGSDAPGLANWFLSDSFELLGRAVGSSARAAGALLSDLPLQGQVNLLTTGAFDNPFQLLELERTRSVAFFAFGAPVGTHGDWTVRAALNQGDLSSWILAGNYARRETARHRYQFGMSYGVHSYAGGNPAAMAAVPDAARNVGIVYAADEWKLARRFTLGYGGNYAHYDYLARPAYLSPKMSATIAATESLSIRAAATRQTLAPGAEEFVPPAQAQVLPPQRTFAPLTADALVPEELQHYEVVVEQIVNGATLGARAFHQRIDNQLVTVFGMRTPESASAQLGHYFVGSPGDVAVRGWGVTFSREVTGYFRGTIDYSFAAAEWTSNGRANDRTRLARRLPSALRTGEDTLHDVTTSLETTVPQTSTRVFFVVKMNSGYIRDDGTEDAPGLDGRFDMQISQGLPFVGVFRADWEMLVGVRNLFYQSPGEGSIYDELLVARPPKRLVGGITVKF